MSSLSMFGGNCLWSPIIIAFLPKISGKDNSAGVALLASS